MRDTRHKGLTDLYLTAVPSERSTTVTCGQYSSRYVSPLDARRKKQQPEGQRKEKKKKKTQTAKNSLPHRIATARQPSMREEIKFSPPLAPASPLAPLLPACLPACLSDSRCDFLKLFCMLLRGCVQRADFARGRQVRNEEDDDALCGTLSVSLAISGIRTFVRKYVY